MIQRFLTGLENAERTLAEVKAAEIKLPLTMSQVRMDLNAGGVATDEESLLSILTRINRSGVSDADAEKRSQIVIAFDDGDVVWLIGKGCQIHGRQRRLVICEFQQKMLQDGTRFWTKQN